MIDGTTFVLIDYGTPSKPDLAFAETAIGTSFANVMTDIRDGKHENVRSIYTVFEGKFVDMTTNLAQALTRLPPDTLSQAARDFIDYFGLECVRAAE
jgi:hypothetical protein